MYLHWTIEELEEAGNFGALYSKNSNRWKDHWADSFIQKLVENLRTFPLQVEKGAEGADGPIRLLSTAFYKLREGWYRKGDFGWKECTIFIYFDVFYW